MSSLRSVRSEPKTRRNSEAPRAERAHGENEKLKEIKITINLLINKLSCSLCGAPEKRPPWSVPASRFSIRELISIKTSFLRARAAFSFFLGKWRYLKYFVWFISARVSSVAASDSFRNRFQYAERLNIVYALHHISFAFFRLLQRAPARFATADPNMQLRRIIGPNACCGLCSKSSETRKKRKRLYAHFQIQFLGLRGRQSRERPES